MGGFTRSRVICTWQAARLGCTKALVDSGWINCHIGCINGLRKYYSHFVGGSFLAGKAIWLLNGCLLANNDYCKLVKNGCG